MTKYNTLIVSLFGGPGAGKSSFAHGLMYELKISGINCEFASEYAKDIFYEESPTKLDNQIYVFGKQLQRIKRVFGKVHVIITDAPLLHSIFYDKTDNPHFSNLVLHEHNNLKNNLNIFLVRNHSYNPNGRFQTEKDADNISNSILEILRKNNIYFETFESGDKSLKTIVQIIKNEVSNLNLHLDGIS